MANELRITSMSDWIDTRGTAFIDCTLRLRCNASLISLITIARRMAWNINVSPAAPAEYSVFPVPPQIKTNTLQIANYG